VSDGARIAVLLPVREALSKRRSGAVALSMRDFTAFSQYRAQTIILGALPCDLDDTPFHQLAGWRRWHLRDRIAYSRAAAAFVQDKGVALVEVQNRPTILTMLRKLLPKTKLTLYFHNDPQEMEGTEKARGRRSVLDAADAIYCNSKFVAERFLEGLTDPDAKVRILHYGLDTTALVPAKKEKIVAFAGRIVRDKGIVELIQAFARGASQMPDWRLAVAGEDKLGLLQSDALKHDIAALGARLTLLGHVDHAQTMALFARAEIATTPAIWREPFGRTTMEAMALGCAVVSSGSGGSGEILGDCGEIVRPVTASGLATALVHLTQNEARRRDLQMRGAARAVAHFDIRTASARLDDARSRLLDRQSRKAIP
jgi:UDP-glucose:(glucosyl)LPS alpha-1,2-glucosyltransferase